VITWVPTARLDVENVALPEFKVAVPSVVDPSRKVTVPVGVPEPDVGVTVAAKVTTCPNADAFNDDDTAVVVVVPPVTVCVMAADVLRKKLASPP
jgi:hypothetical protein